MEIDRLRAFLGYPEKINNIDIYSPTLRSIAEIGYEEYMLRLQFSLFDKERIFVDLFGMAQNDFEALPTTISDFYLLVDIPAIREQLELSLSFFTHSEIVYSSLYRAFMQNDKVFISEANYKQYSEIVKFQNTVHTHDIGKRKMTSKAKSFQERINMLKKKAQKKEDNLELKDIVSVLCNAGNNGINIFNVVDLTIYQVFEQFERLNMKETYNRILPVWANGHLSEGTKFPEWIKRTKL